MFSPFTIMFMFGNKFKMFLEKNGHEMNNIKDLTGIHVMNSWR